MLEDFKRKWQGQRNLPTVKTDQELKPLAIWITDLHISPDTIGTVKGIILQVIELCQQIENPVVILGGDIFDSRAGQPQSVLSAFSEILDAFYESGIAVVCIPGNHDKVDYCSEASYLDAYNGRPNFTLLKEYHTLSLEEHGMRFHFIPYFDEKLAYRKYLELAIANVQLDTINILFTHIAVSGARNNDGTQVSNEISVHFFHPFRKVLIGHYHNRQVFDNVIYTGSAYQANFGEDTVKGCTVIYTDGSFKFVDLNSPKYKTHQLELKQLLSLDTSQWTGNNRIKLLGKPDLEQAKKIQQLERQGIKVEYEYEVVTQFGDVNDVKSEFTSEDILAYLEEWCAVEQIEGKDKEFGFKQLQS